jgi:hypothetical protein
MDAPELYEEVRRKFPSDRMPGGGRPPKAAKILGLGLSRIAQQSKTWLRYCTVASQALRVKRKGLSRKAPSEQVGEVILILKKVAQSAGEIAADLDQQIAVRGKKRRRSIRTQQQ